MSGTIHRHRRLSSFAVLLVGCLLPIPTTLAWTSRSSTSFASFSSATCTSFAGSVLQQPREASYDNVYSHQLIMKKGKSASVPTHMRGQYARMKEMQAQRDQMMAASQPGTDGMPVFNLFVRTEKKNMWYPCGSFKGDERSAALAKSYAEGGLLAGISKNQLDGGISGSLFKDKDKLVDSICRAYPQLRKNSATMEFGYKLAYAGLDEERAKEIIPVEIKEQKGVLDGIKNVFSGGGK